LLVTAGGQKVRSLGETMASLELIGNYRKKIEIKATILENTPQPLILGVEFLREMQAAICLISNTLTLNHDLVLPLGGKRNSAPKKPCITRSWTEVVQEIPGSIFSLPSSTAWAVAVSSAPSKDRGVGKAIRDHLADYNTEELPIGSVVSLFRKNRHTLQMIVKEEGSEYIPTHMLQHCCRKLKDWAIRNKISKVAIPRLTSANSESDWEKLKDFLYETFKETSMTVLVSRNKEPRPRKIKTQETSPWNYK